MPQCRPQPSTLLFRAERTCTCCRQIMVKLVFQHAKTGGFYWVCKGCDLSATPAR